MITCRACNTPKPESEYKPSNLRIGNRTCRECGRKALRVSEHTRGTEAQLSYRFRLWHYQTRTCSLEKGIIYNLSTDFFRSLWRVHKGRCAITGIQFAPLRSGGTGASWDSPSIDRIEPVKGYVAGNVRLVLFCVNSFRGLMTDDQMRVVIKSLQHF